MFATISRFAARNTWLVGCSAMSARYLSGDVVVQASTEFHKTGHLKQGWLDVRRAACFGLFGFTYSPISVALYTRVYPAVLGARPLLKAVVDCTTHGPFLYFPAFYMVKEFIFAPSSEVLSDPVDVAARGLRNFKSNFVEDFKLYLAVWMPLHWMNFKVFPRRWTVPVMALQGIIWVGVLSAFRGSPTTTQATDEEQQQLVVVADPPEEEEEPSRTFVPNSAAVANIMELAPHMKQAAAAARARAARNVVAVTPQHTSS